MEAMKNQNLGHFGFRARNEETWRRFESIWQAVTENRETAPFIGEAVTMDPEARSFNWDLNGVSAASRVIFELFAALYPLQRDARRADTDVDFTAEWSVNDAKGRGRGRMGLRIPKSVRRFDLLTYVRYNVLEKNRERRERRCGSKESSHWIWTAHC